MIKREDAKKQYPLRKIIGRAFWDMSLMGYRYYGYMLLDVLIGAAVPFLLVLLPAEAVRRLEKGTGIAELMIYIVVWIICIFILNYVRTYAHHALDTMSTKIRQVQYERKLERKALACEITKLENAKERELLSEVTHSLNGMDGTGKSAGVTGLYFYIVSFVINVLGFFIYAIMSGGLSPWLFLVLFFTSVINYFGELKAIKYQFTRIEAFWENSNRFWYMKNESINLRKAKDIRMYGMQRWFEKNLSINTKEATSYYTDIQKHHYYAALVIRGTAIIRDVFSYGFLILQLSRGSIQIADFLLYLGIVSGFGTWITQIVESYTYLRKIGDGLSMCLAYMDENEDEEHEVKREKLEQQDCCSQIIFENISFGYGDHMVFENFSLTLQAGEKIALVGINGAGKTTLMKLLCGLYPLNSGRILIDGKDIKEIPKEQYYRYISILFQDVQVLPLSIAKNISCAWNEEEKKEMDECNKESMLYKAFYKAGDRENKAGWQNSYDERRIMECLKQVKLWEKVCGLKHGIYTNLTKILDLEGISLSGGESQRLMLARALYKNAPILILDEPTAALDPIAESELYEEYSTICKNKISLFISHRLSSTRFCDRILYLEGGRILEQGDHESLMQQNGNYAVMYQLQAHYYQKEVEKHEAGI